MSVLSGFHHDGKAARSGHLDEGVRSCSSGFIYREVRMIRQLLVPFCLVLAIGCTRRGGPTILPLPSSSIRADAERLQADIAWMADDARQGRATGSPGEAATAAWVAERFRSLGLRPFREAGLEGFEMPFDLRRGGQGRCVAGVLQGQKPGAFVVIGAHMDHLGVREGVVYNGADDNASGVAAVLEAARLLSRERPERSIVFVAFSGEEIGMVGSRAFAARLVQKGLAAGTVALNLDMFGPARGQGNVLDLWDEGMAESAPLVEAVRKAASTKGFPLKVHPGRDPGSDGLALASQKIPTVCLALAGDMPDIGRAHPHYHKSTDDVEHLDLMAITRGASVVAEALRIIAR